MTQLLRQLWRRLRGEAPGATEDQQSITAAVLRVHAFAVPSALGLHSCAFDRWYQNLAELPPHRWDTVQIREFYSSHSPHVDHSATVRRMTKIFGEQPPTLAELLSWPQLDLQELVRHCQYHQERLITPN